ncbi:hypothetical protein [Bradyrhizobium sp. WD16]|uniref:hypothetical protein n=1 Tax=Bradyrhizobium sp. WD16 TaxID=1521768 RepID=UPI0020A57ABC|nr:hypothetical protein [Bradyrhizobium sp. WD16]
MRLRSQILQEESIHRPLQADVQLGDLVEISGFEISAGYISCERGFVAKFKDRPQCSPSFVSFLIANFTVEDFFGRIDAGETVDAIAESKGYLRARV